MKKLNVALCTLAVCLVSGNTLAAEGQGMVTFNGKLTDDTCVLDEASKNMTVTLPVVSTKTLALAGATAGASVFNIKVTDCPTSVTKVAAHFEANDQTEFNPATGNLVNKATSTAAGNTEVRLYNYSGTVLPVGSTGAPVNVDASHAALLTYTGGYYATAPTTAGVVTAQVQYTLAYP